MDERTDEAVVAREEDKGGNRMIEMGKRYQTRDGRAVRILCTDLKGCGCATVIGLVTSPAGPEYVSTWTADGRVIPAERPAGGGTSCSDLVPVPTKHEGWVVVGWQNADGSYLTNRVIWNAREDAVEHAKHLSGIGQYIAHVTWED
jgi:hypothetical protein